MNDYNLEKVYEQEELNQESIANEPSVGYYRPNYTEMFENELKAINNGLVEGKTYYGIIQGVYYNDSNNFCKITVEVGIQMNNQEEKYTVEYVFGGDYDAYSMKKLINFLKTVENAEEMLQKFRKTTIGWIAKSMQILNGAPVSLVSRKSKKGDSYITLSLLGKYDKENNSIEG